MIRMGCAHRTGRDDCALSPLRIGVFEKGGTEMEKKTYESMDLEVVRFQTEDVIMASATATGREKLTDATNINLVAK